MTSSAEPMTPYHFLRFHAGPLFRSTFQHRSDEVLTCVYW